MITIIDSIVSSFRKYYPILQSVLDTTDSNLLSDDFIKNTLHIFYKDARKQRCTGGPHKGTLKVKLGYI